VIGACVQQLLCLRNYFLSFLIGFSCIGFNCWFCNSFSSIFCDVNHLDSVSRCIWYRCFI